MRSIAQVVMLLPLLSAGCGRTAPGTTADQGPVAATIARVRAVDVPATFEAGGIVRARATASIASRLLAPIVQVHVRAGDRVRRGAPLVSLEGREIVANQARAAATLTGSVEAVAAAEGAVRSAGATLTLARTTHQRVQTLLEQRSATPQELDQAVAALDAAEGQDASARANLAAAAAAREAARAASDAAAAAVSYTTLTAPFDGVVTDRRADPGTMASPGVVLVILEDPAALRLEVAIDESRASAVSLGQTAEVSVDSGPGEPRWSASRVGEIARVDPAGHSFLIKLDLPAGSSVRSGAFGRARFAGPLRRTLLVPASATLHRGQLTFAFTVDGGNRARLRPISTGATTPGGVEVLSGLAEGARIILDAPASLSDGTRVTEAGR